MLRKQCRRRAGNSASGRNAACARREGDVSKGASHLGQETETFKEGISFDGKI